MLKHFTWEKFLQIESSSVDLSFKSVHFHINVCKDEIHPNCFSDFLLKDLYD